MSPGLDFQFPKPEIWQISSNPVFCCFSSFTNQRFTFFLTLFQSVSPSQAVRPIEGHETVPPNVVSPSSSVQEGVSTTDSEDSSPASSPNVIPNIFPQSVHKFHKEELISPVGSSCSSPFFPFLHLKLDIDSKCGVHHSFEELCGAFGSNVAFLIPHNTDVFRCSKSSRLAFDYSLSDDQPLVRNQPAKIVPCQMLKDTTIAKVSTC